MHMSNRRQLRFLCGDNKVISIAVSSVIGSFVFTVLVLSPFFHTCSVLSQTQSEILNSLPFMDSPHVSHYCRLRKDEELATVYSKIATTATPITSNVIVTSTRMQIS
jgi:hypothetical protein